RTPAARPTRGRSTGSISSSTPTSTAARTRRSASIASRIVASRPSLSYAFPLMPVFKAYDIRGKYPSEIDEALAERLGGALVRFLKAKRIAVGRDVRLSAPAIAAALSKGAGCE